MPVHHTVTTRRSESWFVFRAPLQPSSLPRLCCSPSAPGQSRMPASIEPAGHRNIPALMTGWHPNSVERGSRDLRVSVVLLGRPPIINRWLGRALVCSRQPAGHRSRRAACLSKHPTRLLGRNNWSSPRTVSSRCRDPAQGHILISGGMTGGNGNSLTGCVGRRRRNKLQCYDKDSERYMQFARNYITGFESCHGAIVVARAAL